MKKLLLSLFVLMLVAGGSLAQTLEVLPGWEAIVIREASDGITGAPFILDNDVFQNNSVEFGIVAAGQKAALATDLMNGAKVSQISSLHIDRLDDVATSGSLYGPYFNIWVTDGLGNFAVIANEPSDAEWAGSKWDVADWNFLKTKRCKVYETTGSAGGEPGTSWVATYTGMASGLIFDDVADLIILPPSPAYIAAGNGIGSGAPDELTTNIARGYNWVFGDTAANYVTNGGFVVNNYTAVATLSVQNVTQGTSYATIEGALAAAAAFDVITIDDGTYNPPNTLNVNIPLTISGATEAGVVINIPTAGGYGISVASGDVLLENFTLVANVTNENFPIHASGTSNPPLGFDNLTLQNITISGTHRRTGFDVHGYNTVVMSQLTSSDATGGNGAQITGCVGVTVDNITTTNNAWGSFAIYASSGAYLNRGSANVVIDGASCVFGEGTLFSQDEFGLFNTNLTINGYGYMVRNYNFRPDAAGFTFFLDTEANAVAYALGLDVIAPGSFVTLIAGGTHIVVPGLGIRFAVHGASSGDVVNVAGGTYVESGQILVDKDVSIIGDPGNRAIVMRDSDTGSSGDPRGWFLQTAGTHLVMQNLELDGTGYRVWQVIRSLGSGLLDNCAFRNITFDESGPSYAGTVLAAFGAGNWDVTGCSFDNIGRIGFLAFGAGLTNSSFSGNTYTGKGAGDWLDYACDISSGAVLTVDNNTITACEGVATVDGSTSAGLLVSTFFGPGTTVAMNNNILTGNTMGVAVGYDASDTAVVVGRGNDLSGNATFGVSNSSLLTSADFLSNWWGDASGPFHASLNPAGTGVPVDDNILFDPWSGKAGGGIVPVTTGPLNCGQSITLTFNFTADTYTPDMFLYNAVVSATAGLDFGAVVDLEPFGTVNNNFFAMSTGANQWTITGSTVGSPSNPVTFDGTTGLFTITFSATGDVVGGVTFDSLILRDPDNNTIPVTLSGATITYDCTSPAAATAITAAPGNNKVDVSWTHTGADVVSYEIYRGLWYDGTLNSSAYPEYDDLAGDVIPTRPTGYGTYPVTGEWVLAGTVGVGTNTFTDTWPVLATRGVYYYEVFAIDAALNPSAIAAANDRATSYWLGDVYGTVPAPDPNGTVDPLDINELGAAFGTIVPLGGATGVLDVGPTDDWSRLGIPTTDSAINFEDLMIFSMNFGVVTAAKERTPASKVIDLAWVSYEDGSMALRLVSGTGLKGLRIRSDQVIGDVTAGQLLDAQSELTFLKNVGQKLDLSVAVMGVNQGFEGMGDLFVVRAEDAISVEELQIVLRGTDNQKLEFRLDKTSDTVTPRVFALNANYPNPFNPMTKISFSLPETQAVKLAVYSIDGRRVATLLNETRGPGLHEIVWTGRNDDGQAVSSGLYFYRIDAGPYSHVRKMTLMK